MRKFLFFTYLFINLNNLIYCWESSIVYYSNGKLTYEYDAEKNRIPDFSYAGYKGGCVDIPNVPAKITISPIAGDNTSHIQSAIDYIGSLPLDSNGIRGAVLLKAGKYDVYGTIYVKYSGVVLRGEGNGSNPATSTIIYGVGDNPHQRSLIVLGYGANSKWSDEVSGTRQNILDNFLSVGSNTFSVADTSAYNVGDNIIIVHPSTQQWLDAILGGETGADPPWQPGQIDIKYNTYITSIDRINNKITTASPIFEHFNRSLSQAYIYKYKRTNLLTNTGIENLRVDNDYASDTDENHVWESIEMNQLEDSWANSVVAIHFGHSGFYLMTASRITIQNCQSLDPKSITDGGRKYNYHFYTACSNILIKNCHASLGRHHFISNGTSSVGGIVIFNCTVEGDLASSEGHRMWSTGILFDNLREIDNNITIGILGLYNRGDYGTSHGWGCSHCIAWNCNFNKAYMMLEKPPTSQNYAIGCKSTNSNPIRIGPFKKTLGYIEGTNQSGLNPSSLYLAQLAERCTLSTPTKTLTFTSTITNTPTRTFTLTGTNTFTNTRTYTPTATFTFTVTNTHSSTITLSYTNTATRTLTYTTTITNTTTNTKTFTFTSTIENTATNTRTFTITNTSTNTRTPTETITGTQLPTWTQTTTDTSTITNTPTRTFTLTGTNTITTTNTFTNTFTQTMSYTNTNTVTFTYTETATQTRTNTIIPSVTPTNTLSFTPTGTNTAIPTNTQTGTYTATHTYTITNIPIVTMSYTATPTNTATPTQTEVEENLRIEVIKIYPNPVKAGEDVKIKVRINKRMEEIKVKIYTVGYRNIKEIDILNTILVGENEIVIREEDIKKFAKGIYYYVIMGKDEKGNKFMSKINEFILIK